MGDRTPRICSIAKCGRKHYGRGWCSRHYQIWRAHGDPEGGVFEILYGATVEERFWQKVDKTASCWEWAGSKTRKGYGNFHDGERLVPSHRYSYRLAFGEIPEGMLVDHVCHNRGCVNPDHLRLATNKQNIENVRGARSDSSTGIRGVKRTRSGKFVASVRHHGVSYYLGTFSNMKDAEAAVVAKRNELFTHNDADRIA